MVTARKKTASKTTTRRTPARKTTTRRTPKSVAAKGIPKGDGPLIFSGPPTGLRAEVTVANTGDRRLAVRSLTVVREGSADVDASVSIIVPPGRTVSMPVLLPMDPGTRPGDYPAEVHIAGVSRAAVLRVEAELTMHIAPQRLLVEPGRHKVSIVAVNEGNVDLPLAPVTRGRTSDGGKDPGPDITLTLSTPVVLKAASTVTIQGQLDVPQSLEPTRRHTASVPVGLADLKVIILPRKAAPEAKP